MQPNLPVGFYKFHKDGFMNYQLNRWYSAGYTRLEDIKEAGERIKSYEDNKSVFLDLADRALREKRLQNAAFYYRAAEFFTLPDDPDKEILYFKFSATFYEAFKAENIERHQVPYGDSYLSAQKLHAAGGKAKGTIVIHGGFDSFIEEFFSIWKYFAENGYTVIAFDGPGQGASLVKYHVFNSHDWEKPVGAVLDYFRENEVTLLGISFGGYWCVRAAAFEKRIKRLIVHPPLYDLLEAVPSFSRKAVQWFVKKEKLLNFSIRLRMKLFPMLKIIVLQCLYINGKMDAEPAFAARWLLAMNKEHIHSELVGQDVLLLGGEKDRFQSVTLLKKQKAALVNAKSVTERIFTEAEHGENHCQMGNPGLALEVMGKWLNEVT